MTRLSGEVEVEVAACELQLLHKARNWHSNFFFEPESETDLQRFFRMWSVNELP